MKTAYGNDIVSIQQRTFVYEVTNNGQIDKCFNTQAFYDYVLIDDKGIDSGIRMVMDVTNAKRFTDFNGLTMLK